MPTDTERSAALAARALAALRALAEHGALAPPYAVHIAEGVARVGWGAADRLVRLDGAPAPDGWTRALSDFAAGGVAFGYVGFDAWDRAGGLAPDGGAKCPLVQFFRPLHHVELRGDGVTYAGPDPALGRLVRRAAPSPAPAPRAPRAPVAEWPANAFRAAVAAARGALGDGLSKVVLSRFVAFDAAAEPAAELLDVFAALCARQTWTDAILLDFGDIGAALASPELLVRVDGGRLRADPLAGTRPRADPADDACLARALLADRKELAEHVLAVRQMLDELRPLCAPDTLGVTRLLDVVPQRAVLHLGSTLTGRLAPARTGVEALAALFPSAMVSGVPRGEAIRLIRALEPFPRGLYAGAAGWAAGRDCRFALNIRGVYRYGDRLFAQAGAGIMAESDPDREAAEVDAKMAGMRAVLGGGPERSA